MAFLTLDREKLAHNYRHLDHLFASYGMDWGIVTKLLCGDETFLAEVLRLGSFSALDSRVSNLATIKRLDPDRRTVYIKPPAAGAIKDVVRWADVSFNTEIETLEALDAEAARQGVTHDVLIMVEMGDLREGVQREDVSDVVGAALALPNLRVIGLGANLNCLSGVMPDEDKLHQLGMLRQISELRHGIDLPWVSGGTTVAIPLLRTGRVPEAVNHFRVGEALYFGRDLTNGGLIEGMHGDVLRLHAEVIETRKKPMTPSGELGANPQGEVRRVDANERVRTGVRAIVDVGWLDLDVEHLTPVDDRIRIEGVSSDMMVVEATDGLGVSVGDEIAFDLGYMGALRLMNSPYVDKRVVGADVTAEASEGEGAAEGIADEGAAGAPDEEASSAGTAA